MNDNYILMSETTKSKTDGNEWILLTCILAMVFTPIGLVIYVSVVGGIERDNLIKKTISIGEEGYLSISEYVINEGPKKYLTIKVIAVDVQNDDDDNNNNKIVTLHITFKNIGSDIADINQYGYYLITDEEHSYQNTAILTIDGTKVLKDTHKECVMKFSIPADEKPIKLAITEGNRIVKEIVLKSN
jgi:hypothetical protein